MNDLIYSSLAISTCIFPCMSHNSLGGQMSLFKFYSNKNYSLDILDKKSKLTVDKYHRENINLDLLDLKICVPLTFGYVLQISSRKQALVHDGQREHEVLFCVTS